MSRVLAQAIMATAVPAGRDGSRLRLSVRLSPRLGWANDPAAALDLSLWADFRDGAWPGVVMGSDGGPAMTFEIVIVTDPDGSPIEVVVGSDQVSDVTRRAIGGQPDARAWRAALFSAIVPASTQVTSWQDDDFSSRSVRSFPLVALSRALDAVQAAAPRTERPTRDSVLGGGGSPGLLGSWVLGEADRAAARSSIAQQLEGDGRGRATAVPDTSTAAGMREALVQAQDFLAPARVLTQADLDAGLTWPRPDFHELMAYLGSHPSLMRELGLLVDLEVDVGGALPVGECCVAVRIGYAPADPTVDATIIAPYTRCTLGIDRLVATRRTPETPSLTPSLFANVLQWSAVTSEVESESIAVAVTATDVARARSRGLETRARDAVRIPARRSAGIAVAWPGIARAFRDLITRASDVQQQLNAGPTSPLYAEDLVIGYRLDVQAGDGPWRSLHRRQGILTPPEASGIASLTLFDDEGWVEPAPTDGAAVGEWRLTETVARWLGWSLSLPRPGRFLDDDDRLASRAESLPPGVALRLAYYPPPGGALLPALRFGRTYELRLRTVDAAGNSPPLDAGAEFSAGVFRSQLSVPYRRHEPVPPPDLYAPAAPPGLVRPEAFDVMIVRSEGGGAAAAADEDTTRYLAPPRGSQWLCEQHGRFDDEAGRPSADLQAYESMVARESAAYDGAVDISYLPDPMATGVAVGAGPSSRDAFAGSVTKAFGGTWPALQRLRLQVVASGTWGTVADADGIVVRIAPGRQTRLRLSSTVAASSLPLLDLWGRVGAPGDAAQAAAGRWWQLTPDHEVLVVHATRRPASAPRFVADDSWTVTRAAGETAAVIDGVIRLDQPSTASVAVRGALLSGVDRGPGGPEPALVTTDAGTIGVRDLAVPASGVGEETTAVSLRVAMPDHRRRRLTVSAIATSRYAEYFRQSRSVRVPELGDLGSAVSISGTPGTPVVAGSVRVSWSANGVARVTGVEGVDFEVNAAAGSISRVAGAKSDMPAAVRVSWITAPIVLASTGTTTAAERTRVLTLPASTRPEPPAVVSVLPAFAWNAPARPSPSATTVTSARSGGLLRVYLQRPWWTSGLEEDLAIVLRPASGATDLHDTLATRWGLDPVTTSGGALPDAWPAAVHFTNRADAVPGVPVVEADGARVDLALFRVGREGADGKPTGYDTTRGLWYADIAMDQDFAYRPFVRLALARYQASAPSGTQDGPDLRLSPITVLDVVQLEPDRVATVQVPAASKGVSVTATVTLAGPSYATNDAGRGPGPAVLILEESPRPDPDGTGIDWTETRRVEMTGTVIRGGRAEWTGLITVPRTRPAGRYRLVIEQFESWRSDGRSDANRLLARRLVHQDIIRL